MKHAVKYLSHFLGYSLFLVSLSTLGAQELSVEVSPSNPQPSGNQDIPIPPELQLDDDPNHGAEVFNAFDEDFSPDLSTLHHTCLYADGESLKEVVEALLSTHGNVTFSKGLDILIVRDLPENLESIKQSLMKLDEPLPQVQVQARVIEITLDNDTEKELSIIFEDTGLSSAVLNGGFFTLGTPGPTPSEGEGIRLDSRWANGDRSKSVDGFIRYLITENKAKILSSPTIVAGRGKEASIITGEEVPIQTTQNQGGTVSTSTEFKSVGIKLKVTPLKIGKDSINLLVTPEVSSVNSFDNDGNPIVAIHNTRTTLTVKDGQLLIIGGLHREESSLIEKKIPLLGDIPILGWLFRSTRDQIVKSMLVFYLKVDILEFGEQSSDVDLDSLPLLEVEKELEKRFQKSIDANKNEDDNQENEDE